MNGQHSFQSPESKNAPRILSVDDEPGILRSREMLLQLEGYEVINASDGEQALKLFDEYVVDMVLLDYLMPGIDGGAVAREMRRRRPETPIIMISASLKAEVSRTHVDCILPKGESPRELFAKINQLLQLRK